MTERDEPALQICAKSVRMIAAFAILENERFPRSPAMYLDLAKEAHRLLGFAAYRYTILAKIFGGARRLLWRSLAILRRIRTTQLPTWMRREREGAGQIAVS